MSRLNSLLVFLLTSSAFSQPDSLWSNHYGGISGEACYSILQTSDGGYALGGYTQSWGAGWNDFWFVRADAEGDSLWSRTFGGGDNNMCRGLLQSSDGGFALLGSKELWENGAYNYDFWLIRTNSNGDSTWSRTFGGLASENGYSLAFTSDGGYIMGGMTTIYGVPTNWECSLMKANSSGDSVWARRYGGPNEERCHTAFQTDDGGYAVIGKTHSFGHGDVLYPDFWFVKTNANGDSLWSRAYGGDYTDECLSACQTQDGGYALAGNTNSFGVGSPSYLNLWLVRTNSVGDTLWTRTFGGESGDVCEQILETSDGGFVMVGTTYSYGSGDTDMWLVRTDSEGNLLWQRTFGGTNTDRGYAIAATSDGGYVLGGETSSVGFVDMWLVKTGPDGGGGGETTLLSEGFDGGFPPAGWQIQQMGAATANWQDLSGTAGADCGDTEHSGANAVFHNDDQGSGGTDVRDLLISPVMTIPPGAFIAARLEFFQRNCYVPAYYTDSTHHWVMSSVDGGAWVFEGEFDQRVESWEAASVWIPVSVGQQLRIAFDYQGDYATEWYLDDVLITVDAVDVPPSSHELPMSFTLSEPYPNPFNSSVRVELEVLTPVRAELSVFNLLGQRVEQLQSPSRLSSGHYAWTWTASQSATGMYLFRLNADNRAFVRKAMLIR